MKNINLIFLLSLVLLIGLNLEVVKAQQSLNTAHGNANGNGGSFSYSAGELAYQTQLGANGSSSQGIQHPFEITVVTSLKYENSIEMIAKVYPNPTADHLILHVSEIGSPQLQYALFDINGKLLLSEQIIDSNTNITMNHLEPSIYFIVIQQENVEVKRFKIIKH